MDFIEKPVKVGRITKTHGVHGGMVAVISSEIPEPDVWPDWVFIDIDGGLVPFGLQADDVFFKDDFQLVFFLKGITQPSEVEFLLDRDFYLPEKVVSDLEPDGLQFPDLNNYEFRIKGQEGSGSFVDLLEIPSNRVFQLDWQGRELLIPARDEFIDDIDEDRQIIWLSLPEGLFNLN